MAEAAELYDKVQISQQARDGLDLMYKLCPRRGNHVLDLGCGTGYLANILAERVGPEGKVTGVDPDKERLQVAQKKFASVSNLEFVEGHSENFPVGPYDIVFSNHVFHWIENKELAIQNIFENMKAGGQFGIVCSGEIISEILVPVEAYNCESEVYEIIASKCGFILTSKSVKPHSFSFPSAESYIEWQFASVGSDRESVDPNSIEAFKKEVGDNTYNFDVVKIQLIFQKPYS